VWVVLFFVKPQITGGSPALQPENIPLTLVQKRLRKMRDYMTAYKDGADGQTADSDL
jgi:hypothetical protein